MTITIIGTGLIGGSLAISLREQQLATTIIGVDQNQANLERAKALGLIDTFLPLEEAFAQSRLVILAIPVDGVLRLLPSLLDKATTQVIMDVGSTKGKILDLVKDHPHRGRFV
ncbi:MAG TPA: prephenate dehydrogenase/arogenate dehydrogenase family protein, partial [Chitinophaga sp.]